MQNYNNTSKKESLLRLIPINNKPYIYQVELDLPMQKRFIGQLDFAGEGTFTTKRKEKHLFRKTNSLGLNYALLNNSQINFKWIVIDFEGSKLVTTREYFKIHGKHFQFTNKAFELQVFLPIEEFGVNRAREFEKVRGIQSELFIKHRKAV